MKEKAVTSFGRTIWHPRHSRTCLSTCIAIPGHQALCLRCCLSLVMPWCPRCTSCASWIMRGSMASGTTIQLLLRTRPRFWQSSSLRALKGSGAVSQFPGLRQLLMIFSVGSDSEVMSSSWRVIARGREIHNDGVNVILHWVSGSVGLNRFA